MLLIILHAEKPKRLHSWCFHFFTGRGVNKIAQLVYTHVIEKSKRSKSSEVIFILIFDKFPWRIRVIFWMSKRYRKSSYASTCFSLLFFIISRDILLFSLISKIIQTVHHNNHYTFNYLKYHSWPQLNEYTWKTCFFLCYLYYIIVL